MKRILILMGMLLFVSASLFGQTIRVTGTVTSQADGTTLPGVAVQVVGTTIGAVTDINGRFTIDAPSDGTLRLSFVGMQTMDIAIQGRTLINVALEAEAIAIEEFVVVGFGVQRRREVTGAISQVRGDDMANFATPSFDAKMVGRSAGVQITQATGVLGQAPRIRVRGIASISSGTGPLIVLDGQPITSGDIGGYAHTNALADINPADIESIEILKDGSATAIYGSRAAAGVILITTRRGREGRFQLNYNNYFGIAQPVKLFDLTNEEEWVTLMGEMFRNAGTPINPAVPTGLNTDWQRAVLRENAFQQDHNLSLSGGTAQTNYFFSMGYTDMEGVSRPNAMNRITLRANLEQRVGDWLTVGINSNLARTFNFGMQDGENALSGNMFSAIRQLPNTPIHNPNHPTGFNIDFENPLVVGRWNNLRVIEDNLPNIVYTLENNTMNSMVSRAIIGTYGIVNILPSLVFQTRLGADIAMTEGLLYWNPLHGDGAGVRGRIYNTQTNFNRWNIINTLSFVETIANRHNLNITLVQEAGKLRYNFFFSGGDQISDPFFRHGVVTGTFATQLAQGSIFENAISSYAGRLNYNFDNRYFLQFSLRYDGLSSLPRANRWGLFPGGSIGWTISQERFMQNIDWLSDLRVRASYAEVGNSNIGNYPYLGLYGGARYADHTGLAFIQMGNDQLLWETSRKFNVGFDFSVLDGKYSITYDHFIDNVDGLILAAPTPPSFGIPGNSVNRNIGAVRNWGHEIGLQANFVRTRDFSWTVDANLTFIRNEVVDLATPSPMIFAHVIHERGHSLGSIFGFHYLGVNMANGNPMYRRADGSVVQADIATQTMRVFNPANPADVSVAGALTGADRIIFGPSMPTYFGSVINTVRWHNFDFSAMVRFSGGNYIMNRTRVDLVAHSFTNLGREMLGRWQSPENPGDGWTPRLWHGRSPFINRPGEATSRFIEEGDFIKLQNVSLGYTLPQQLVGRLGIERLRLFVSGTELFTITDYTGIDPEAERFMGVDWNGTPRQRTFTIGVNLSL